MKLPGGVKRLFRLPLIRRRVAREVDEELAFHMAEKTDALIAQGYEPSAAKAEARRQLGDVNAVRSRLEAIDTDAVARTERREWWNGAVSDFRLALRAAVRSPGVTVTVVAMLGLGIGGAAAMYGLLDRLLLRVGPGTTSPGELRRLYIRSTNWWDRTRSFSPYLDASQIAAVREAWGPALPVASAASLTAGLGGRGGERVPVDLVSGQFFSVLGVRPALGRLVLDADDQLGARRVAVISYGLWRRQFAGAPSVLGRSLALDSLQFTIVGVAARGFSGLQPDRVDVWVPMQAAGPGIIGNGPRWNQSLSAFDAVVRLVDVNRADLLAATAARVYRTFPRRGARTDTAVTAQLVSVNPGARPGDLSDTVRLSLIIGGLAVMLCLIAVANATNLLLLRSVQRRRETAVRLALGVSRGRLIRAVVLESLVLSLAGAASAMLFASWGGGLLQKLVVQHEWQRGIVDGRVLIVAAIIGLLVGVITGLVPGWQASRPDAIAALKAGARTGAARSRVRASLVGLQAALTVVLLVGSALYVRSFLAARGVDFVVDADHLIDVDVSRETPGMTPAVMTGMFDQVTARVRRVPGVAALARATIGPIYGFGAAPLQIEGVESQAMNNHGPFYSEADSAFFGVTGLSLLRGRGFTEAEVSASAPVAVVNDAFVQRFWPGQNPIGKCLYVAWAPAGRAACQQVVGVVSDYRHQLSDDAPRQDYYLPLGARWSDGLRSLLVRTSGPAQSIKGAVDRAVRSVVPDPAPNSVVALSDITSRQMEPWRNGTTLFILFAGLAVALAMGGLYAVVAFSVAQRRHEMAIRVAVGARPPDLVRLVLRMAFTPVAVGLSSGLGIALWLVRFIGPLLFHTTPRDPVSLVAAVIALILAAGLACIGPAASAIRADPREALQAD